MKKGYTRVIDFFKILLLAGGLVFAVHQNGYAGLDVEAYGGYSFRGTLKGEEVKGPVKGITAHYNGSFLPTLDIGIGAFYQVSELEYERDDRDAEATRKTLGMDLNLVMDFPLLHPYGRLTWGVVDVFEDEGAKKDIELFRAWGAGLGVQVAVFPFFSFYGEYRIDRADHGADLETDSAILGLRFNF